VAGAPEGDVLVIQRTGGGKAPVYKVPAILEASAAGGKTVLVVVPFKKTKGRQAVPSSSGLRAVLPGVLGLAKFQQSVNISFSRVVCELKAAELDFPCSVPKAGLYRQVIQAVSMKNKIANLSHLFLRCLHE
jgi:hypothetical protein